jgi:hypothetical protein
MYYPNLLWALGYLRIPQYRLADFLAMSESCLSRRLAGRADFTPGEKQRIAEHLGFRPAWLFSQEGPPASARLKSATTGEQNQGQVSA